jgi:hypothetical protein
LFTGDGGIGQQRLSDQQRTAGYQAVAVSVTRMVCMCTCICTSSACSVGVGVSVRAQCGRCSRFARMQRSRASSWYERLACFAGFGIVSACTFTSYAYGHCTGVVPRRRRLCVCTYGC